MCRGIVENSPHSSKFDVLWQDATMFLETSNFIHWVDEYATSCGVPPIVYPIAK